MATPTQIRRRGRFSLILGTLVAAVLFAAMAYADDITSDLPVVGSVKVMALNEGGPTGSTLLTVIPTGTGPTPADGKAGCNLTGGTSLVVSVSSSNSSVATVSPTSLTFTSCGDVKTLTVTPHAAGSSNVTLAQTSNNTGGTFNFAPAAFRVDVAPPPNTAPNVTVTGVEHGASYAKGSVPAAGCSVEDAEDGNSTFAASLSSITGPYASDGIGNQTATCSYTDAGGLTETVTATYSIYDPTAPEIGYTLNPAAPDGNNGWYKSTVSLTWNVSEPESPNSLQKTGCVDQSIASDQGPTTYSCSATSAGGSTGPVEVTFKRDATAPTISGAVSPASPDGDNGWYKTAPTATFTCSDATSGIFSCVADGTSPASASKTLGESASPQTVNGTATDNAGNSNTASVSGLMVDLSDPTVDSWTGSIEDGDSFYFGSVPAAPTCTAADAISGPKSCVVTGYSNLVGNHTLTATATDNAGRTGTDTRDYTVLAWTLTGFYQPVSMSTSTTVWNTVKNGSTVPLKFNVFAATELTDPAIVASLKYVGVACSAGDPEDPVELTTTGGTSLRYDSSAGQFVYNWQTPKKAGACYKVTVMTLDGSSLSAYFKLK